jgi:hypothetical protein
LAVLHSDVPVGRRKAKQSTKLSGKTTANANTTNSVEESAEKQVDKTEPEGKQSAHLEKTAAKVNATNSGEESSKNHADTTAALEEDNPVVFETPPAAQEEGEMETTTPGEPMHSEETRKEGNPDSNESEAKECDSHLQAAAVDVSLATTLKAGATSTDQLTSEPPKQNTHAADEQVAMHNNALPISQSPAAVFQSGDAREEIHSREPQPSQEMHHLPADRRAVDAGQDMGLVNLDPRVSTSQIAANTQALVLNNRPYATNPGRASDYDGGSQLMQYRRNLDDFGHDVMDARIENDQIRALNRRMSGIDLAAASMRRGVDEFHVPVHYEVSQTYHSEIISSNRRRYRPRHHFDDADEYADRHYHSSRRRSRGVSGDERRLKGYKRHGQHSSSKKSKRREKRRSRYDEDSTDDSDLEVLRSSSRGRSQKRSKKDQYRSTRNDDSSEDLESSELDESPEISRKKLKKKEKSRSSSKRSRNDDGSDGEETKQSRRERPEKIERSRSRQRERYSDDSETESQDSRSSLYRKSSKHDKRKVQRPQDANSGSPKKSPGSREIKNSRIEESPRRAKTASQTSVLESVSPARKERRRFESPRRAKSSQSSVLEGVGSDSDTQNVSTKSPNKPLVDDNASSESRFGSKGSSDKKVDDTIARKPTKPVGQSYWLAQDGSESDWDFEGPMILPPTPI